MTKLIIIDVDCMLVVSSIDLTKTLNLVIEHRGSDNIFVKITESSIGRS